MDTKTAEDLEYERYIKSLPRAQRRQMQREYFKLIDKACRAQTRQELHDRKPPIDPNDPFLKRDV